MTLEPKSAILKKALNVLTAHAGAAADRSGPVGLACLALVACGTSRSAAPATGNDTWTEQTHGKDSAANYALLFSVDVVHTIEVTIDPNDFEAMQADLDDILGESGGGGLGAPMGDVPDPGTEIDPTSPCEGQEDGATCELATPIGAVQGVCVLDGDDLSCSPQGFEPPGAGGVPSGGGVDLLSRDPMYVPVEIRHDGRRWEHVGMRYKGNSSLASSHGSGIEKLPFRLDFDQFEAEFPDIVDQRFYGFKKLTFSSNWSDDSQVRETYVSELLRDRGIPAARCAFYRVMVDSGNGPAYWGLYTLIEDPADGALLDSQLGGRGGNLYKPEGAGADWTTFSPEGFVKKTNEDDADWSDVQSAVAALHADTTDRAAWRAQLEATFDVELFLTWLAVNTTIVNWDTYGGMAHNYYLYGGEVDRRLRWIPWDHNLSMASGGIGAPSMGEQDAATEILHKNVGSEWPLIQRLLADPIYLARYRERLGHALEGLFTESAATTRLRELHDLVVPHVVGSNGERPSHSTISSEDAFLESIDGPGGLIEHVLSRHARVEEALRSN